MDEVLRKIYWVDDLGDLSRLQVLTREQEAQTVCPSFGDFIPSPMFCDVDTAKPSSVRFPTV